MTDRESYDIRCFEECLLGVLEKMAFLMAATAAPEELLENPGKCLHASMDFSGPENGRVWIAAQDSLCAELASNMLGSMDGGELSAESKADALKEILNMTCGQYLTSRFGEEPVFDLTVPVVEDLDGEAWRAKASVPGCLLIDVEGCQILAFIQNKDGN